MQNYRLPTRLRAIAFDIDKTLYDNDEYAHEQIESQLRMAASHWGISLEETRKRTDQWRGEYARRNDGQHQSLGNTLAALGIPIPTSVQWRVDTIRPGEYLRHDERLRLALADLSRQTRLIAVTNNPVAVGVATLSVLGVSEILPDVVGLDTTGFSKPSVEPFLEALRRLGTAPGETISVGDRYDVDIAPALAAGMGGVLVESVAEVYALPDFLRRLELLDG